MGYDRLSTEEVVSKIDSKLSEKDKIKEAIRLLSN